MIRTTIVFLAGVYVGQEYGKYIPSVKSKVIEIFNECKKTDLYKKIVEDIEKSNKK